MPLPGVKIRFYFQLENHLSVNTCIPADIFLSLALNYKKIVTLVALYADSEKNDITGHIVFMSPCCRPDKGTVNCM